MPKGKKKASEPKHVVSPVEKKEMRRGLHDLLQNYEPSDEDVPEPITTDDGAKEYVDRKTAKEHRRKGTSAVNRKEEKPDDTDIDPRKVN